MSRPNFLRVRRGVGRRPSLETPAPPKGRAGLPQGLPALPNGPGDVRESVESSPESSRAEDAGPNDEVDAGPDRSDAMETPKAAVGARESQLPSSGPRPTVMGDGDGKEGGGPGGRRPDAVLFFVHGVGGSLDVWRSQLDFFSRQGYETIAVDLLGHGRSSAPKTAAAYTFYALSREVAFIFMKYAGRTNVLIGHSYG